MKRSHLVPNLVTYGCLLDACVKNNEIGRAHNVFNCMLRDKIQLNTVIYTTMIKAYSK
jgi:pentatricopeptide repeat domain-containing protein 1